MHNWSPQRREEKEVNKNYLKNSSPNFSKSDENYKCTEPDTSKTPSTETSHTYTHTLIHTHHIIKLLKTNNKHKNLKES
jgi:hypothetical protein